ncbi:hypothetical protein A4G18_08290 [Pasteurellaceae bacterium Pebbles2]|nr:hypothetical protein [Pasteurellaceae bacterium Pebbles2]
MKNHTALLNQLAQYIAQLEQDYSALKEKTLYTKFDPMLFSENFQEVSFYLNEIQQTFTMLSSYAPDDISQIAFFSEKLQTQCLALQDAVAILNTPRTPRTQSAQAPQLTKRQQLRQELEKLPPRERLAKYYEALQALNEKINEQKDQLSLVQTAEQKQTIQTLITQTKQRHQRCLDAIENLEEYLEFKENNGQ